MIMTLYQGVIMSTSVPLFIVFPVTVLPRCYIFLQIDSLWQACIEQVYQHLFCSRMYLLLSLCHVLLILATF